jgi:predicted NUDIX family NTP pyrophosphohydrolase
MAKKESAGILLYRLTAKWPEVFLAHPGGPFWKNRDLGIWTIPKGEFTSPEEPLAAAIREFREETGFTPVPPFLPLTAIRQKSGKRVYAWAAAGDLVPALIRSNTFSMEWPPRSGRKLTFPEVDKGNWFPMDMAREKIIAAQIPFLDELETLVRKIDGTLS